MQTGLVLTVNFVTNQFNTAAGTYWGLFTNSITGITHTNAGLIKLVVNNKGKFSGTIYIEGDSFGFSSALPIGLNGLGISQPIVRHNYAKSTVGIGVNAVGVMNGGDSITGTVIDTTDGWISNLQLYRGTNNTSLIYAGTTQWPYPTEMA